ncbi:MAG TPA: lytic transglycosylase domain-containing protein [Burkholderiales bacterium]|nr:lytic transglycosylase domain-containing protein [Burkholderiales bacterium]
MFRKLAIGLALLPGFCLNAWGGNQQYEPLSASVSTVLSRSVADTSSPRLSFDDEMDGAVWLADMSTRLRRHIADDEERREFLITVHYEATRAGLDPQLVLALIQVESGFRKYAISKAGARGYMQVMPFWLDVIGDGADHNLFDQRTNLRYGCVILRHYLDIEKGNLFRALGRYNGSLGKARYPNLVRSKWKRHWNYVYENPNLKKVSGESAGRTSERKQF